MTWSGEGFENSVTAGIGITALSVTESLCKLMNEGILIRNPSLDWQLLAMWKTSDESLSSLKDHPDLKADLKL